MYILYNGSVDAFKVYMSRAVRLYKYRDGLYTPVIYVIHYKMTDNSLQVRLYTF